MGSSSSKVARTSASAASRRQYPQRVPPTSASTGPSSASSSATETLTPGPTVHPPPRASETKDEVVSLDARDPDFAASLRSLGPVQPNSTLSNTSTFRPDPKSSPNSSSTSHSARSASDPSPPSGLNIFPNPAQNPALVVLESRSRLAAEAEEEFTRARMGGEGRRFLDVGIIRQILTLRDKEGMDAGQIEKNLGLRKGVVRMLAAVGEGRMGKRDKDDSGIYD
ncbi:MAG: hypothetical protein Q9164_006682 [Protoblastenia rupestris]